MSKKVLFVDDDMNVLEAVRRQLRKKYDVETAWGSEEGVKALAEKGPFAVVVSDMRMPGMDGIQLLTKVRETYPFTVRIMLTGLSDQGTAMNAVNEGNIFRFLTKPATPDVLGRALDDGLEQYRLLTAEQELLENTLTGSIKILTDILSLTNPDAFSTALRVKHYASQIAETLGLADRWQYDVAAMLSQVGHVTLPAETLEKLISGEELDETERAMAAAAPEIAKSLIERIPRLMVVAGMIGRQNEDHDSATGSTVAETAPEVLGGRILRASIDLDRAIGSGTDLGEAVRSFQAKKDRYHPAVLEAASRVHLPEYQKVIRSIPTENLKNGMVLAEDIRTAGGILVATKGQEVNPAFAGRLANFYRQGSIPETVRVHVQQVKVEEAALSAH
ncbi:MAG: HD domain-containing phosphohydrolase [Candidatus Eisenbacteria bacterium]